MTLNTISAQLERALSIHDLKEDGVDHINIHPLAYKTEIGHQLSLNAYVPFEHPLLGRFTMLLGYWFYLKSGGREDRFRSGNNATALRQIASNMELDRVDNFRALVVDGMRYKIEQNPRLREAFLQLPQGIPFTHYYISGQVRVDMPGMRFLSDGLHLLHHKMLEGEPWTEPSYEAFSHLIQRP